MKTKKKKNKNSVLKECSKACLDKQIECPFKECGYWIDYQDDKNCDLISIEKYGSMTLRQIGERLGVSYVRIKQIESAAIKKLKNKTLTILND